jgi:SAM-dependent methyltransferase
MTEPYDTRRDLPTDREASVLDPADPAYAGQAVYTPAMLRAYDTVVVRVSNTLVWRCPAAAILGQYDRHVGGAHLDIGPGTGYYLARCRFPGPAPRLTLLDPNPAVLRFTGDRLWRYRPARHAADALKPIGLAPASFESVGLSYVLHCLPGDLGTKAVVFDHVLPLVRDGGVVFGTTILGRGVRHNRLARTLLRVYNRKGIFDNLRDDREGLERALAARFVRYEVEVTGAVAFFAGWVGQNGRRA